MPKLFWGIVLIVSSCLVQIAHGQSNTTKLETTISFNDIAIYDGLTQYSLHYALAGDITKPGILFLHGTPGSWSAFKTYLNNPSRPQYN